MCGIAGIVSGDGAPVDRELLERMCAALEHRGPDARGVDVRGSAGLGIQRLRVVDIEGGDQPIYNEDRSVAVVLNGEIYNFRELRRRLEHAGHRFRTAGDTEVIVHLYEEMGVDCVRALDGMFAFALWDESRHRLLVARDRVGKKPLFYALRDGRLSFASELRALLQDGAVPRDLDEQALDCYLAYGYVPAPLSIFRAVRKLEPGSSMVYEGGDVVLQRYWGLDCSRKLDVGDPGELHERLLETLRAAVRRRLVADVPVGAFLSGGIDSSAVVAAMAQEAAGPVRTFSIGFDSARFDELAHARRVAELFGTEHEELYVRPDAAVVAPRIARHHGEPFADSSAIPSFYLAELTRRHVTVALNGDGGTSSSPATAAMRRTSWRLASNGCRVPCGASAPGSPSDCRRALRSRAPATGSAVSAPHWTSMAPPATPVTCRCFRPNSAPASTDTTSAPPAAASLAPRRRRSPNRGARRPAAIASTCCSRSICVPTCPATC